MDETARCQGCGSPSFRWIAEWELLMCNCCVVAVDYVTEPERQHILEQINRGAELPSGWCCWIYQPETGCCRIHGNPLVVEPPIPLANQYRGAA